MISIIVGISATAGSFEYEGLFYRTLTDSTVEVTNPELLKSNPDNSGTYDNSIIHNGKVTIPSKVSYFGEDFTVVRIGDSAFRYLKEVREYEIPNTILSIGEDAFTGNLALENITIPENVTSISRGTFRNTISLKSINLHDGITFIGKEAFAGSGLLSIILPNSLTSIESRVFAKCIELLEITLSDKVESIEQEAFDGCSNLESIYIGSGLKSFHQFAFNNCKNISKIVVSEENPTICSENNIIYSKDKTEIHFSAPNQIGNYVMPNTVELIYSKAFNYSKLHSIKFSENLKHIYLGFEYCNNLTALVLPSSLTIIGDFISCENLRYLVLGENFEVIGYSYNSFNKLDKIICYNVNPPIIDNSWGMNINDNVKVYVPKSAIDAYKSHPNWTNKEIHGLSDDELIFRPVEAIGFEYNKMFINKNEYFNIGYTIYPKNATLPILRWEVSNPEIVKIDTDLGKGMGLSEGTCTITAYSIDGSGIEASFEVEVKDNAGIDDALDESDSEPVEFYNIHGIKLMQPTKGVNIVKYKDGTVRKVYNR